MHVPLYKNRPPRTIAHGKYCLYEKIGEGAWGKVRRAIRTSDGRTFACKQYYRCVVARKLKGGLDRLKAEFALAGLWSGDGGDGGDGDGDEKGGSGDSNGKKDDGQPSANLLKYHEMVLDDEDKLYVVMEYCARGSVEQLLGTLPLQQIAVVMRDVLQALLFLHSHHIFHHDIKPGNLLISAHGVVKLADFGVAEQVQPGQLACSPFGTPAYQSPEVISGAAPYDGAKADMWSCGVLLYQLSHKGQLPWHGTTVYSVMKEITQFDPDQLVLGPVPSALLGLIKSLLSKDPGDRPTAKEALQHPFIKETNSRCAINV